MASSVVPVTNHELIGGATAAKANALPLLVVDNGDGTGTLAATLTTTSNGSVTPPGTSASMAQAVQGVTGGLPVAVTTTYTTQQVGTWNYYTSANGGTITVGAGQRVIGIAAHSTTGGSFTINGGASVAVPANSSIEIQPIGNITAPTLVFSSGIDSAFVETVM